MNFTREPIIETIITPKEGYKLIVRNSKSSDQEEYSVDAVEVVSFGHSFFFRSLERPKSFLVPVSDFEIIEVKETRVVLKNVGVERSIKIGGGREGPMRGAREPAEKAAEPASEEEVASAEEPSRASEGRGDRKRDRRRHRRRRGGEEREMRENHAHPKAEEEINKETSMAEAGEEGGGADDETQVSSSMFSRLIPPPTTLISETIGRYKDAAFSEGAFFTKKVEEVEQIEESSEEKGEEERPNADEEKNQGSENNSMSRVSTYTATYESNSFTSIQTLPPPSSGLSDDRHFRS